MKKVIQISIYLLLGLAIMLVYAPALDGYYVLDDYEFLAYVRMLDAPWALLFNDSMPAGVYYRPIGMVFWWLSVHLFGSISIFHYIINIFLHIAVSFSVYRLLCMLGVASIPALLAALLFGIHPIGIGTALWLSDRFDLLAALFGLWGLIFTLKYIHKHRSIDVIACFISLALALLSKEIGLTFVLVAGLTVLLEAIRIGVWCRSLAIIAILGLITLMWLLLRSYALPDYKDQALFSASTLLPAIAHALSRGLMAFATNVWFFNKVSVPHIGLILSAFIVFLVAAVKCCFWKNLLRNSGIFIALALCFSPVIIQAPALVHTEILGTYAGNDFLLSTVQLRFYYVASIGLFLLLGIVSGHAFDNVHSVSMQKGVDKYATQAIAFSLTILIGVFATASYRLATQYRVVSMDSTAQIAQKAQKAVQAVSELPKMHSPCLIFFLDTGKDGVVFRGLTDSIIKGIAADLDAVKGCAFQSEVTPWIHLFPSSLPILDAVEPMQPLKENDSIIPWMEIGNITVAYLNLFPQMEAQTIANAHYFSWREQHFEEVTHLVLSGEKSVAFACVRPAGQCHTQVSVYDAL